MQAPPEGFTDLRSIAGLSFEIGYHREDNFTGARVPGYDAPGAWLLDAAARAVKVALADLAREDLGLIVYDAYRPLRACRRRRSATESTTTATIASTTSTRPATGSATA